MRFHLILLVAKVVKLMLFIAFAYGFKEIHFYNYLRVRIFAILLSFAEIAETNTRKNMSPKEYITKVYLR